MATTTLTAEAFEKTVAENDIVLEELIGAVKGLDMDEVHAQVAAQQAQQTAAEQAPEDGGAAQA